MYLRRNTSLIDSQLTFANIVEEIPIRIRTNPLVSAFLSTLTTSASASAPSFDHTSTANPKDATSSTTIPPWFSSLNLDPNVLTTNLTSVLDALDDYKTEEGNLAFLSRQIAREKAKADSHVQKRKEENALRVSQGLAPLPEEDVSRLFKIPPEPNRLESTLLLGQVDAYAKSLADSSSINLAKMYAANGGGPS